MARLKFGSFRADDFQGSDRKDVFFGLRGNDTISGSGGSDLLIGGRGADQVFGGSGNDLLSGGSGHDTLTGGAGSDVIVGGSGRDLLIYQADQNLGSHDYYNGGRGKDTLRLELSKETWVSRAFQSDLASLLSGSASYSDGLAGQRFTFESLGLNVRRIEEIEIFVEGQQLNDVDDAVVAVDDTLTLTTDVETATGNVLLNDQVADLVTDVTVARQAQFGLVTTAPDGTFTYQLDTDASAVAALTKGETLTDSFEYTVRDADGDLATATVNITITGTNSAPELTIDPDMPTDLAVGNLAAPIDGVAAWFSDADGDALEYDVDNAPPWLAVGTETGQAFLIDAPDVTALQGQTLEITAVDTDFASATGSVLIGDVQVLNDFGDGFGVGREGIALITGALDDRLIFGQDAFGRSGDVPAVPATNVSLSTGEGRDTLGFGNNAFDRAEGVSISTGGGNDALSFEGNALTLARDATVDMGAGDDTLTFSDDAFVQASNGTVLLGDGADMLSVGRFAFGFDLDLGAGDGDADTVVLGRSTRLEISSFEAGIDTIRFEPSLSAVLTARLETAASGFINVVYEQASGPVLTLIGDASTDFGNADLATLVEGITLQTNAAPELAIDPDTPIDLTVGNLAGQDSGVATWFVDPDGDDLSYEASVPFWLTTEQSTGRLLLLGPPDVTDLQGQRLSAQAFDPDFASATGSVQIGDVQVRHEFGDAFGQDIDNQVLTTGDLDDTLVFGADAFVRAENSSLSTGGGNDTITFNSAGFFQASGAALDLGEGDDSITFASGALRGSNGTLMLGDGADTLSVGSVAGQVTVDLGRGDGDADTVTLTFVNDVKIASFEVGIDTVNITQVNSLVWNARLETGASGFDDVVFEAPAQSFTLLGDATTDFANADLTTLVQGITTVVANNEPEVAIDPSTPRDLTIGNLASPADGIGAWFNDPDGDALSYQLNSSPSWLAVETTTGRLFILGVNDHRELQGQTLEVLAFDPVLTTALASVEVANVRVQNNFGDNLALSSSGARLITGDLGDTLIFGDDAFGADLSMNFIQASTDATVATGGGNDRLSFADNAFDGAINGTITTGDGDDTLSFATVAAIFSTGVEVSLGGGNNMLTASTFAFGSSTDTTITSGDLSDTITFENLAFFDARGATINTGGDVDTVTFGEEAFFATRNTALGTGDGADTVIFATEAFFEANNATIVTGAGNDTMRFDGPAIKAADNIDIFMGSGADRLTFTDIAYYEGSTGAISMADGADILTFGGDVSNVDINLGAFDGDGDRVVFDGTVSNVRVSDFEVGLDRFDLAGNTSGSNPWSLSDDGSNTTFSDGSGSSFELVGVTGVTDINDLLI